VIGGLVLISVGALFLLDEFIPGLSFTDLWPVILVVIGIGLLINAVSAREHKK
jgi:ABC-type antimicrobial peptide transport system permease subunit